MVVPVGFEPTWFITTVSHERIGVDHRSGETRLTGPPQLNRRDSAELITLTPFHGAHLSEAEVGSDIPTTF